MTFAYRIRLLGVLLGLVVLQLTYLLLIALVAVLTWLYLVAILNTSQTYLKFPISPTERVGVLGSRGQW